VTVLFYFHFNVPGLANSKNKTETLFAKCNISPDFIATYLQPTLKLNF